MFTFPFFQKLKDKIIQIIKPKIQLIKHLFVSFGRARPSPGINNAFIAGNRTVPLPPLPWQRGPRCGPQYKRREYEGTYRFPQRVNSDIFRLGVHWNLKVG